MVPGFIAVGLMLVMCITDTVSDETAQSQSRGRHHGYNYYAGYGYPYCGHGTGYYLRGADPTEQFEGSARQSSTNAAEEPAQERAPYRGTDEYGHYSVYDLPTCIPLRTNRRICRKLVRDAEDEVATGIAIRGNQVEKINFNLGRNRCCQEIHCKPQHCYRGGVCNGFKQATKREVEKRSGARPDVLMNLMDNLRKKRCCFRIKNVEERVYVAYRDREPHLIPIRGTTFLEKDVATRLVEMLDRRQRALDAGVEEDDNFMLFFRDGEELFNTRDTVIIPEEEALESESESDTEK